MGRETSGAGGRADSPRAVVYCMVPRDLAPKLFELLRRHFAGDPSIEVIVEHRAGDRRGADERRLPAVAPKRAPASGERRAIRSVRGRRVGDRRAAAVAIQAPSLPRKARPYTD